MARAAPDHITISLKIWLPGKLKMGNPYFFDRKMINCGMMNKMVNGPIKA